MFMEDFDDNPVENQKQIRIYVNGDASKYIDFRLGQTSRWSDIWQTLKGKFGSFEILRLFTAQGVEIVPDDLTYLKDGYSLYASKGEEFDPYSPLSHYQIVKTLGEGGFGKVMLGKHRQTSELVAIKIIKTIGNAQDIDLIFREAEILKSLDHRNIVKVYNSYILKNSQVAVVMEYLEGGELTDRLRERTKFSEEAAMGYFVQIAEAVSYCHQKKLIHRDLKLENILVVSQDSDHIKVIDFGIAGFACIANTDNVKIGSLIYMAPEILSDKLKKVNSSVDVWAMGVILYQMLFGIFPFNGKTRQELINNIIMSDVSYPQNNFSQEAIDMIELCLTKEYEKRIHTSELRFHPWLKGSRTPQIKKAVTPRSEPRKPNFSKSPRHSSPNISSPNLQSSFKSMNKLQVPLSKFRM